MPIRSGGTSEKHLSGGVKRIQRAKDKEDIIQALLSDEVGIFKEIWRILLFAAQVGYKNRTRETLKSVDTGKGIDQGTFSNSPAWPGILYLMALADTEDSSCLSGSSEAEDERINMFQEYANSGLTIIKKFFSDKQINIGSFLEFIETQKMDNNSQINLDLTL
jgi:dnd system-associated protein 4